MLYIFSGLDDYSINQELDGFKKAAGDSLGFGDSSTTLDGQKLTPAELKNVCETLPFLSGKRLVIVHGLLGRFNPKRQPKQNGKNSRNGKKSSETDKYQEFAECLTGLPPTTDLILVDTEVKGTNPLFKAISGQAQVKTFSPLKEGQLAGWVQKRVKEQGGAISPRAATLLARLIGSDLWTMANEADKLVLYASGRSIEEADIDELVSYSQQANIFHLVDAIIAMKTEQAERLLQRMLESGAAPAYLMTMITRQFQLIIRAGSLKKQKLSLKEIQSRMGIPNDFVVRKALEQGSRYSFPRLKEIYHQLLESDMSVKTGKTEAELALTILVAELCQLKGALTR